MNTDDDIEAYGFTRLYAAVGWGTSSLFGGWLTDKISGNSEIKNYTPLLMSASLFMVCDLFLSPYIEVRILLSFNFRLFKSDVQNAFSSRLAKRYEEGYL